MLFPLALGLALSACGTNQTLEQAINCDQFKRLPDGTWSAKDASLDYVRDGKRYQFSFNGSIIITAKEGSEEAVLLATLDKKCVANR